VCGFALVVFRLPFVDVDLKKLTRFLSFEINVFYLFVNVASRVYKGGPDSTYAVPVDSYVGTRVM